jgi:hypothetical protein
VSAQGAERSDRLPYGYPVGAILGKNWLQVAKHIEKGIK